MSRIALVTGASRGIGKAIALELARQNHIVIGTATTQAGAEQISATFTEHALQGEGVVLNVANMASVEQVFKAITEKWGAPAVLVNNAGITCDNLIFRMKEEEWDSVLNTNLTSLYRLTKLCLKPMLKTRWGRIVSISSVVGSTGNPGQANYAAAKAGIVGFSKAVALEVGSREGITVNVVAPGFIDTDMTQGLSEAHKQLLLSRIPISRLGKPEEIADAVAFLVSDKAAYITGHTLDVNGGMYMN